METVAVKHLRPFELGKVDPTILDRPIEIFNDLFFLGQLPRSTVTVKWCSLGPTLLARTYPPHKASDSAIIYINANHPGTKAFAPYIIRVLLHEMVHVFFVRFAYYPKEKALCASGACGMLQLANIGFTGHGRAWQFLTRAIEEKLPDFLGITGNLGRQDGLLTEIRQRSPLHCLREIKRLHSNIPPRIWRLIRETRDDNDVWRLARSRPKSSRIRARRSSI